jgi:hypothetical protein
MVWSRPYTIDTTLPSTYKWMCPLSGVIRADVYGTIVALVSRSRTRSTLPWMIAPGSGSAVKKARSSPVNGAVLTSTPAEIRAWFSTRVELELVKFDTQKLQNPEIAGVEYRRGSSSATRSGSTC